MNAAAPPTDEEKLQCRVHRLEKLKWSQEPHTRPSFRLRRKNPKFARRQQTSLSEELIS